MSSSGVWTNGGHSRGGGSSNSRHHAQQYGGSPASMMLNSYCSMTNSKFLFSFFFLMLPDPIKRHGLMRWWLFLLFLVGRQEKEKKNTWQIEMKESRSLGHCQVNTQGPPAKKESRPKERDGRETRVPPPPNSWLSAPVPMLWGLGITARI